MKEEEEKVDDLRDYVEYIDDIVFKTDFSDEMYDGAGVSSIFSANIEQLPEEEKNRENRKRLLLKYFLIYVLTMLYYESEWKKHQVKEEISSDDIDEINKDDAVADVDDHSDDGNDTITVSRDIGYLTREILSIDKHTLNGLSTYGAEFCSRYLPKCIDKVISMAKSICRDADVNLDIIDAKRNGNTVTFTLNVHSESIESDGYESDESDESMEMVAEDEVDSLDFSDGTNRIDDDFREYMYNQDDTMNEATKKTVVKNKK